MLGFFSRAVHFLTSCSQKAPPAIVSMARTVAAYLIAQRSNGDSDQKASALCSSSGEPSRSRGRIRS